MAILTSAAFSQVEVFLVVGAGHCMALTSSACVELSLENVLLRFLAFGAILGKGTSRKN